MPAIKTTSYHFQSYIVVEDHFYDWITANDCISIYNKPTYFCFSVVCVVSQWETFSTACSYTVGKFTARAATPEPSIDYLKPLGSLLSFVPFPPCSCKTWAF